MGINDWASWYKKSTEMINSNSSNVDEKIQQTTLCDCYRGVPFDPDVTWQSPNDGINPTEGGFMATWCVPESRHHYQDTRVMDRPFLMLRTRCVQERSLFVISRRVGHRVQRHH